MQFSFEGMESEQVAVPRKYRLFFAVRPNEAARCKLLDAAGTIRQQRGLRGTLLPRERLHLTLQTFFESKRMPPAAVVELALRAGNDVTADAFPVMLDTALSFARKPTDRPLVITGSRGTEGLADFRAGAFASALRRNAMGSLLQSEFVPHVTTLYDDSLVPPVAVDPICWLVDELELIESHVGLSVHRVLGRWPLLH